MSALIVALSLGLSLAFLDVLLSLPPKPTELAAFSNLFAPIGVSALAFLVLFTAVAAAWSIVRKRLGRDRELPVLAGLVVFLATSFTVAAFARLFSVEPGLPGAVWVAVVLAASLVVDLVAYAAVLTLRRERENDRRGLSWSLALPALLFEGLVFAWTEFYQSPRSHSLGSPLLLLGFCFAALVTTLVCRRVTKPAVVLGCLATGVLLVFASSIVSLAHLVGAPSSIRAVARGDLSPKHIILISIDTLRPDCLSCYRADRNRTPHIDSLAADGFLFRNARSPAPWTLPSMVSVMTGVSPFVHMVQDVDSRLPGALPTLAGELRSAGYQTVAIGRSPPLRPHANVCKGFSSYMMLPMPGYGSSLGAAFIKVALAGTGRLDASTGDLTDAAVRWLRSNSEGEFFLWLHYFDPHEPYTPPAQFLPPGTPPPRIGTAFDKTDDIRAGFFIPTTAERTWIRALYEGEVRYVDSSVGRVLDALRQTGLYDDALIVLTSDHGEEFWDHGAFEHGHSVYNELLHVPLIVKLPHGSSRGASDIEVSTASIMPTVLDLCGIQRNWEGYGAGTLLPILSGRPEGYESAPVVSTSTLYYEDRAAIFFDGLKYILSFVSGREELYDLAGDPGETVSIAERRPDAVEKARSLFEDRKRRETQLRERFHIVGSEPAKPDVETIEELRSLGYVK